jgi:hypothetical protein
MALPLLLNARQSASAAIPAPNVEDVFSVTTYVGNGSTQSVPAVDLSTNGGMVLSKARGSIVSAYAFDTARGVNTYMNPSTTTATTSLSNTLTGFTTSGFNVGSSTVVNQSSVDYVAHCFAKAARFFDIQTFTAGSSANRRISHNLGVAPGMIWLKRTDSTGSNWYVYHVSQGRGKYGVLNGTAAFTTSANAWGSADPTTSDFGVNEGTLCTSGGSYEAFVFAHDSAAEGVIQCGTYTGSASAQTVTLGWEPQFLLWKRADSTGGWNITDTSRDWSRSGSATAGADSYYSLGAAAADVTTTDIGYPVQTGFYLTNSSTISSAGTWVYMAIRRGMMATPTDATKVFSPVARTGTGGTINVSAGFPPDLVINKVRSVAYDPFVWNRLSGTLRWMETNWNTQEFTSAGTLTQYQSSGVRYAATDVAGGLTNTSGRTYVDYFFRRAKGFMDLVHYGGNGSSGQTVSHGLGAVPELAIVKRRTTSTGNWVVVFKARQDALAANDSRLVTNSNGATGNAAESTGDCIRLRTGQATDSYFTVEGTGADSNLSSNEYIAILFATVAGVSKVGTYTGNGTGQNINCGFSAGARFVLIKPLSAVGNWSVFDTARGIVAAADPTIWLNLSAIESSSDIVDPYSAGFAVTGSGADVNTNGVLYGFLAIA